jgi:hypothetical protein
MHSICNSSKHALTKIKNINNINDINNSSVIFTADITSLYPNIPIDEGILAIKNMMLKFNYIPHHIELIISLLSWVLKNNFIAFNNNIYLQIMGTAMGTPVAPTFAQIYLFALEEKINIPRTIYLRYIDDLFAIFNNDNDANQFLNQFNASCPTIQLETVSIGKQGVFLDILINIDNNNNTIYTNVYQKDINKYTYIPTSSHHNPKMFVAYIKEEIKRYWNLCSKEEDFRTILGKFQTRLQQRGYNHAIFASALIKFNAEATVSSSSQRDRLRRSRKSDDDDTVYLIFKFNNNNIDIKKLYSEAVLYKLIKHINIRIIYIPMNINKFLSIKSHL